MRSLLAVAAAAVLLMTLLSGCSGDENAKTPEPIVEPVLTSAPVSSYLHDLSEATLPALPAVTEHERIPVDESTVLDGYAFLPEGAGPFPLILTATPYYGGGDPALSPLGNPVGSLVEAFLPRGYAVGFLSVRGTGDSGGCFLQGGLTEAKDLAAAVDWLAAREWSNGNVGMIGVSYDGTTPQETWVEGPLGLKTIVPVSGISDMYKYNFLNGVPINVQGFGFNTYYWAMVGASPIGLSGGVGPTDPTGFPGAVLGEACTQQVEVQEGGVSSTIDGNKDAYWQSRDFGARVKADPDRQRASVLYVHGLQDYNVKDHNMEDWLDTVQDTGVPFKAVLGQWQHAWPDNGVESGDCSDDTTLTCRADWWDSLLLAWFDQFLKGIDTGILDTPAVQVQSDDLVWRHEERWPPQDTMPMTLHPSSDGKLLAGPGAGSVSYFDEYGGIWGALPVNLPGGLLPSRGPTAAIFVSDDLASNLTISGQPVFTGTVTASGNRASLVLTLAERLADGTERSINFAGQSLNHVTDDAAGASSIAGQAQTVTLRFLPSDDVVHEGSRLVLYASGNTIGSDYGGTPSLQPISDGSTITLDLDGASLVLPIDGSLVIETPQPFED